jgi:outer membrane protein assembly factor BamD (BamD/ComL family)
MNRARLYWLICCAAALAACNSAKLEWSKATTADTIPAYQAFLSKYPNDAHVIDALARIVSLQDAHAWSTAQVASTTAGYQQYLTSEPNGAHAQAARDEISTRERAAAWNTAQTDGTLKSLTDFLQKYPTGPEADPAREKLKILTAYRAELGTAHSQRAADRERKALAKRFSNDLQNVIVLTPNTNSPEYRITSAPMSEQEADAKCASLKHERQSCKVIQVAG